MVYWPFLSSIYYLYWLVGLPANGLLANVYRLTVYRLANLLPESTGYWSTGQQEFVLDLDLRLPANGLPAN